MEYVIVTYVTSRTVLIDDEEAGLTNDTLRTNKGTHTFALRGPKNYKPLSKTLTIRGTNSVSPKEVVFEKA
jgi:hypothetical protein